LRTTALPGRSAVDPHWQRRPRTAARAIGIGLRHLHDSLPVTECPFSWSIDERVDRTPTAAGRALAAAAPEVDRLVVCHGDACAPNTLLDHQGRYLGQVDLGRLGVADRWADLAVATYSLAWNFEGDWEAELLDAYGIERDEVRINFYRQLWDAS
jgi:kanamycin kinase